MHEIEIEDLAADLPFGARIRGVTREALTDETIRDRIAATFEARGMIVFEGLDPTSEMQVAISKVFGPLKDHPVKSVERLDQATMPGVITIRTDPNGGVVEIGGKPLQTWQPWHFDHSYNNELNRAGVLRAETIAAEGGLTGFADGIQIYNDLSPAIRAKIADKSLIYTLDLRFDAQLFGRPEDFRVVKPKGEQLWADSRHLPRAVHPAIWTRATGEKVLHMSPYGTKGVEGMELEEALPLLEEVWSEVERVMKPYHHRWQADDMLVWDNWRMLHEATGCHPDQDRVMHRTTIEGDYGLGRWETKSRTADRQGVF